MCVELKKTLVGITLTAFVDKNHFKCKIAGKSTSIIVLWTINWNNKILISSLLCIFKKRNGKGSNSAIISSTALIRGTLIRDGHSSTDICLLKERILKRCADFYADDTHPLFKNFWKLHYNNIIIHKCLSGGEAFGGYKVWPTLNL